MMGRRCALGLWMVVAAVAGSGCQPMQIIQNVGGTVLGTGKKSDSQQFTPAPAQKDPTPATDRAIQDAIDEKAAIGKPSGAIGTTATSRIRGAGAVPAPAPRTTTARAGRESAPRTAAPKSLTVQKPAQPEPPARKVPAPGFRNIDDGTFPGAKSISSAVQRGAGSGPAPVKATKPADKSDDLIGDPPGIPKSAAP